MIKNGTSQISGKQDSLFELVKSMSKAEKRSFKLYATRLSGNQEAKFVILFDCLDGLDEYDEARILQRTPVTKAQLPNMKAHLYRQILVSIRLLEVQHTVPAQLREQLEFARILYDKGLYRQGLKIIEKAKETAIANEEHALAIEIIGLQTKLEGTNMPQEAEGTVLSKEIAVLCSRINNISKISSVVMQLYSLYLKLGYARTQKDLDMIIRFFKPKLERYHDAELSFLEKFYFYQARAWYSYIRHDILGSYKYALRWIDLLNSEPGIKRTMYDSYLRGYSRLLDGLYLMRRYRLFVQRLDAFEDEFDTIGSINDNARVISLQIIYTHRLNKYFYEGAFSEGLWLVKEVEHFIGKYPTQIDIHNRMLLYYKIACLYFGSGDYRKCMTYLGRIINTRDPQIRRDLQCYARILNLISSYEAGVDYNIDYQVRSVYGFLVKMNDMQEVQKEMMAFLKRLNSIYAKDLKDELKKLYLKLKPLEQHPYERRSFYYLDIMSWLESKLQGVTVAEVIRNNFLAETATK